MRTPVLIALGWALAACAVVQPDEFSLNYDHGFGALESSAWDNTITSATDMIGIGLVWYVGTTMPPRRAAVLQPELYEPDTAIDPGRMPVPEPPEASIQDPGLGADPDQGSGVPMTTLYQAGALLGAAVAAWSGRKRLGVGSSPGTDPA